MTSEIEELKRLLASKEWLCINERHFADCSVCGRNNLEGRRWRFLDRVPLSVFPETIDASIEYHELFICSGCEVELGAPRPEEKEEKWWEVPTGFAVEAGVVDSSGFIEKLREVDSSFVKALSSFLANEVTMSDGREHPLLKSIADQVLETKKLPSEKQREAFKGVMRTLIKQKRSGKELRLETEDEKEKRKRVAEKLLKIGRDHIDKYKGDKTKQIIRSMDSHFMKHGTLSVAQLDYLRFIVEQLPAECLDERRTEI